METGIIVKGIGGFYYVDVGDKIIECKARGHFRNKKLAPCVGDKVDISVDDGEKGTIDVIHPRLNCFIRPPVSNIDELIIVVSAKNPSPDLTFVDKMLIIAHLSNVKTKICFNKIDLDDGEIQKLVELYNNIGYIAFSTSATNNTGIDVIRDTLSDKTVAFSGFSGVGKSSLLNEIVQDDIMETGSVSERLKRGKHTTRHVELIKFRNGYIVDTPGFSMLDFPSYVTKDNLRDAFPEFASYEPSCKFSDCNHLGNSKVCAVCNCAENGEISPVRYSNYKKFYEQLSLRKEWEK